MSEALEKEIRDIQKRLRNREYRNEREVCSSVVRVLERLGWPSKLIRLEHPVRKGRKEKVDIALFLPRRSKPSIFLELKSVGKVEEAVDQLFNYCVGGRTKFGVATDGASWRFHLPFEDTADDDDEREVRRIDLTRDSVEDVARCLTRYLAFSRVKNGAAFNAATRDYREKIREEEMRKERQTQMDALREEIPGILNDVIINNPNSNILSILVRKCRKQIKTPLRRDVVEEVMRSLEEPNWTWREISGESESGEGENSGSVKPDHRRTVVVGKWQEDFNKITKAQNAFFNALVREFGGIAILQKLAHLFKGNRIQRLAPTQDEIAEPGNDAREKASQLECGWWLSWNTDTNKTDKRMKKAIEIARRMRPGLRVEWRPTDGEIQPGNGDNPTTPTRKGRAKFRIVVSDIQEECTTGTDALVALFKAAWKTFGQGVFEELLEQETRRRGKPRLARTKKDIGLTGKHEISAKEVAPGWWINTNLNQDYKARFANKLIAITSRTHPHVPVKWEPK